MSKLKVGSVHVRGYLHHPGHLVVSLCVSEVSDRTVVQAPVTRNGCLAACSDGRSLMSSYIVESVAAPHARLREDRELCERTPL